MHCFSLNLVVLKIRTFFIRPLCVTVSTDKTQRRNETVEAISNQVKRAMRDNVRRWVQIQAEPRVSGMVNPRGGFD